jgi:hypothetical protein
MRPNGPTRHWLAIVSQLCYGFVSNQCGLDWTDVSNCHGFLDCWHLDILYTAMESGPNQHHGNLYASKFLSLSLSLSLSPSLVLRLMSNPTIYVDQNGPRTKCDAVVFEALAKAMEIIVGSRCRSNVNKGDIVNKADHHRTTNGRFNIHTHENVHVRSQLEPFRRTLHVPFRVDIHRDTTITPVSSSSSSSSSGMNNDHVTLRDRQQQQSPQPQQCTSVRRELLERWYFEYAPAASTTVINHHQQQQYQSTNDNGHSNLNNVHTTDDDNYPAMACSERGIPSHTPSIV